MSLRRLRTLIADDEPVARQVLREHLETFPEVDIIGEAADGAEALRKIKADQPDLVLLDLKMPVMSGFEVVRALDKSAPNLPVIVIVTAYNEHALSAFDAGAVDYLLKPVSESRLRKAVERAVGLRNRPAEPVPDVNVARASLTRTPAGFKIVGRSDGEYLLLDPDEVLAFQAEAELVRIVTTAKQRLLSDQSLKALEHRLEGTEFQRVHRNAIVNLDHVKKMTLLTSQRWLITLSNSQQLIVSKRQARNIRKLLRW